MTSHHYNLFRPREFLTRTPHNSHPFSCKGNAWIHVCSDASPEIIYLSNHWFDTYLEIPPLGIYTSAPNVQRNDEFSQTFLVKADKIPVGDDPQTIVCQNAFLPS